jgi:hypothetical protein
MYSLVDAKKEFEQVAMKHWKEWDNWNIALLHISESVEGYDVAKKILVNFGGRLSSYARGILPNFDLLDNILTLPEFEIFSKSLLRSICESNVQGVENTKEKLVIEMQKLNQKCREYQMFYLAKKIFFYYEKFISKFDPIFVKVISLCNTL